MTVVLANGCFDFFHYGHYLHLAAAKSMGDVLHVAITRNEFVNKGPDRPYYDEAVRAFMVSRHKDVESTMLVTDVREAMEVYKPDIWALGSDYENNVFKPHADYCKEHGIEIRFTHERHDSTGNILREFGRG